MRTRHAFTLRRSLVLCGVLAAGFALAAVAWWRVTPVVSEPSRLAPQGEKLWTFGFVGDTQLGGQIAEQIFERMGQAKVEFALHLGDLVDDAANQSQWDDLLRRAARHRIRIMPVVGNHDRMPDYDDHGEIRFRQYFPALPGTFYQFRHRGINFLMLNSERSLACGSEQARFVRWQLEHRLGTTIVCLHRPVFTSSRRDWAQQWLRRFWLHPALRDGNTVAVLAGHNHSYHRTRPLDGITYVVSGGGSSNLYPAEPPTSITAAAKGQRNHFGLVDVYANCLQVRIVDVEGQDLDRFCLPLKPAAYRIGDFYNRVATELPPLEELEDFRPARLQTYTASHGTLPRPW